MTKQRKALEAEEQKRSIIARFGYVCSYDGCGCPAIFLAHRIAKTKSNIKKYGDAVIHHELNLAPVCSDPRHNDAMNIGGNPGKVRKLVKEIKAALEVAAK